MTLSLEKYRTISATRDYYSFPDTGGSRIISLWCARAFLFIVGKASLHFFTNNFLYLYYNLFVYCFFSNTAISPTVLRDIRFILLFNVCWSQPIQIHVLVIQQISHLISLYWNLCYSRIVHEDRSLQYGDNCYITIFSAHSAIMSATHWSYMRVLGT